MNWKSLLFVVGLIGTTTIASFAQTYNFTNATAIGQYGPTQGQVTTAYSATNLAGNVTVTTQGIQSWTVPFTGNYSIQGVGACGGELQGTYYPGTPGTGASMTGDFFLTAGTTLYIVVGQKGVYGDNGSGGGGGSFVYTGAPGGAGLMIAAGGGGGHGHGSTSALNGASGGGGSITTAQVNGVGGTGNGGSGGVGLGGNAGGPTCSYDGLGAGGMGWTSSGAIPTCGLATGGTYSNFIGGDGGLDGLVGGFGGGGGSDGNGSPGGGGGGYTGGGGGNDYDGIAWGAGAGAGSFNGGTGQVNIAGVTAAPSGYSHGSVVINFLCSPTLGTLVADIASLPTVTEECIATPIAPTASNDCGGGVVGTPDVSFPISTIGTTVVTWTYDDGTNTITQTQNVTLTADVTPPVINNPSLNSLGGQCSFTPPYPTATDLCAGTITGVPNVTIPIVAQGLTVITWTYDDGSGNTVTQTQNITLNDVAPPSLDSLVLADYYGCDNATPPTATATDFCTGALNGTPDVTFPITAPGPTTVTWTYDDGNGNTISQTQDVYVNTVDATVTVVGATITANAAGATYQWVDCTSGLDIVGETNQAYTATVTGNYSVTVTDNGCTATSICSLIDFTGLEHLIVNPFTLFPNPNNGQFNITFANDLSFELTIIDITGKVVYVDADVSNSNNTIATKNLETGSYYVIVRNDDYTSTKKMMVK